MDDSRPPAVREQVNEFVGTGCLLQGIGLLAPFALGALWGGSGAALGVLLLLVLWRLGSSRAKSWRCSRCRYPLAAGGVLVCPACGAALQPAQSRP